MARMKTNQYVTIALLLCLAFVAPSLAATEQFTALVTAVADGGTITVLTTSTMQQTKIRLYGIDCPEGGQAFGNRARQVTERAVAGKRVTVRPMDTDRYGRTVAVVLMPDGKTLNEHLVREGLAWVYPQCTQEDICTPLRKLENAAKGQKRGLWEDKGPVSSQDMQFTFGVSGGSSGGPGDELKHPGTSRPSGGGGAPGRENK